ncbi:hypothetical protein CKA32_000250 [Geitlerinema sp. FC II]|nr:hypothetical protein CKA32_000250 [Geitlerinema sp. FC II]
MLGETVAISASFGLERVFVSEGSIAAETAFALNRTARTGLTRNIGREW